MPIKHGAYSPRLVSARAAEVRTELLKEVPSLVDADAVLLDRYCRAEARYWMLSNYFFRLADERGVLAVPKSVRIELSRQDAVFLRLAHKLGLTPTGWAKLDREGRQEEGS